MGKRKSELGPYCLDYGITTRRALVHERVQPKFACAAGAGKFCANERKDKIANRAIAVCCSDKVCLPPEYSDEALSLLVSVQ